MEDTIAIVIAIILAAILMFIFPLMKMSSENDKIAQVVIQSETSEYVATIASTGKITIEEYDKFVQTIHATGNTYEVGFEIQIADGNSDKKTSSVTATLVGEQEFYSIFTDEVISRLEKEGVIVLKKGDIITVTVKNTNRSLFQILQAVFASTPSDSNVVMVQQAATVGANGQ